MTEPTFRADQAKCVGCGRHVSDHGPRYECWPAADIIAAFIAEEVTPGSLPTTGQVEQARELVDWLWRSGFRIVPRDAS